MYQLDLSSQFNVFLWMQILSVAAMTSAFAVARTSSGGVLKDDEIKPLIDLQNQHFTLSPADTMRSIATACEELGIDTFDIYGDFTAGEFVLCLFCRTTENNLQDQRNSYV